MGQVDNYDSAIASEFCVFQSVDISIIIIGIQAPVIVRVS